MKCQDCQKKLEKCCEDCGMPIIEKYSKEFLPKERNGHNFRCECVQCSKMSLGQRAKNNLEEIV